MHSWQRGLRWLLYRIYDYRMPLNSFRPLQYYVEWDGEDLVLGMLAVGRVYMVPVLVAAGDPRKVLELARRAGARYAVIPPYEGRCPEGWRLHYNCMRRVED